MFHGLRTYHTHRYLWRSSCNVPRFDQLSRLVRYVGDRLREPAEGPRLCDAASLMASPHAPYTHHKVVRVVVGVLTPTGIHDAYVVVRRAQGDSSNAAPL